MDDQNQNPPPQNPVPQVPPAPPTVPPSTEPLKVIQPSAEVEEEGKNNLINVVHDPESEGSEEPQDLKVLSPDELDKADTAAAQQANAMIAEAEIKSLPDNNNLGDDPYSHSSTGGFGVFGGRSLFYLFPNNRSQRILTILLLVLFVIGLMIKYAHYL